MHARAEWTSVQGSNGIVLVRKGDGVAIVSARIECAPSFFPKIE
jgi:hypothetical protein